MVLARGKIIFPCADVD
uniref:Uncharacterized protein n=1 Tax=Anguilla anguilla TaxID=7936 RepID=A0A0E9VYK2_ANGAN